METVALDPLVQGVTHTHTLIEMRAYLFGCGLPHAGLSENLRFQATCKSSQRLKKFSKTSKGSKGPNWQCPNPKRGDKLTACVHESVFVGGRLSFLLPPPAQQVKKSQKDPCDSKGYTDTPSRGEAGNTKVRAGKCVRARAVRQKNEDMKRRQDGTKVCVCGCNEKEPSAQEQPMTTHLIVKTWAT